jgi:hypothetical protein
MLAKPNMLLGPSPVGLIGSVGFLAISIWIFLSKNKEIA